MHSHTHGPTSGRVLAWSLAATSAFVVIELVSGIRAHSLALISDSGHNATDALALLLAWFAVYLQGKPADESRTFGYHRAGVLAAFVNALTLIVLSAWLLYESWVRFFAPANVNESVMLVVAAGGLVLNGGIMLGLRRSGSNDINVRGAFVHMLGDLLGAAAIVAGAVVIRETGWMQIDPLLSLLISLLIIWTAWDITRESLNILLEGLAARPRIETGGGGGVRSGRRARRTRSPHLEPRFELTRIELPCADRGYAAFAERSHPASGQACSWRPLSYSSHDGAVRAHELRDFGYGMRDPGRRRTRSSSPSRALIEDVLLFVWDDSFPAVVIPPGSGLAQFPVLNAIESEPS